MNEEYMKLLYVIDNYFQKDPILIQWGNGLKVKCTSFIGIYETDTEPEDEDYIGEYAIAVDNVEIIEKANDKSVEIFNDCIEISLKCIPEKIWSEDGTVLWQQRN